MTRAIALATLLSSSLASCVFAPNIAGDGYVACKADGDCVVGRTCENELCAPPVWNDERFGQRQLLTIANEDIAPMPKGAAIPIVVGAVAGEGGALLSFQDVGPDFRITDFDDAAGTWHVVTVFVDREADRFTTWIPLQRDVPQGKTAVLAYIESETFDKLPSVSEDPLIAFTGGDGGGDYDGFDVGLDDVAWKVHGAPNVDGGVVNVADNQAIALRHGLVPPVSVTALVRVNGVDCDEVFVGLMGDVDSLFAVGPAAGLFVHQDLASSARIAPDADAVPTDVGDAVTAKTSFQRITVNVDTNAVRVVDDDTVAYDEPDLRPPFSGEPMFFAVQVGGACSVDVDAVWTSALPLPQPTITPQSPVTFTLFP